MKATAKNTKKQVHKSTNKSATLAPLPKPKFVTGPQCSVRGSETVHWKDLVFIHTLTGVVITHESDPVAHAQLCQRHWRLDVSTDPIRHSSFSRAGYDGQSLESNFFVATVTMIGMRKVDYTYLDHCAQAFKHANSAKWCLENLDIETLSEMNDG